MSFEVNSSLPDIRDFHDDCKRRYSDEEMQEIKKTKFSWYVRLKSESPLPTDEDEESVCTVQGYETEFAHDTSDTYTTSSSNSENEVSVQLEYEIDSLPDENLVAETSSSYSEPENIVAVEFINFPESDENADNSDDASTDERETRIAGFWTCVQCNNPNINPSFRYCEKCYQDRRTYFLRSKPKRRRRSLKDGINKTTAKSNQEHLETDCELALSQCDADSGIGSGQDLSQGMSDSQSSVIMTLDSYNSEENTNIMSSTVAKSQSLKSDENDSCQRKKNEVMASIPETASEDGLCIICNASAKNGTFVHGRTGHACCCYRCATKVLTKNGNRCPMCNRKVTQVIKVF